MARLLEKITSSLTLNINSIYLWTDSTVVLAWLQALPTRWKTFVANRVSEIQELTDNCKWNHISSEENPADCLSRGLAPAEFLQTNSWVNGPLWLVSDKSKWPKSYCNKENEIPKVRVSHMSSYVATTTTYELINKLSSFAKLQRTLAYCFRFINNSRRNPPERELGPLNTKELADSIHYIIQRVQEEQFQDELMCIKKNRTVQRSKLASLNPFLDENGILRVGGRIQNSLLSFNQKHPIILPASHTLTKLIIRHEHIRMLHAGTQATLASVRQKYWPINGRNTTRKIIHNCISCFRFRSEAIQQLMGNLPKYRVQPTRPFTHTGVDYGGPFSIKQSFKRKSSVTKAYIALFICLNTKAIHVELVSDLSSDAFISDLRRFISRRGKCTTIHSDNGSNFKGANNELRELHSLFNKQQTKIKIIDCAAGEGIQWKFIPPQAPNFGGIWEAGIKSAKSHLKRVIGTTQLNFEEMTTLLTQIEACLNSRPIIPINDDPTDTSFLTPSHFVIGDSITTLPELSVTEIKMSHLNQWQMIQRQVQTFWKQWSKDYLQHLQQRNKWKTPSANLKVGALVLVKEDNQPPLHWVRGRIQQLHLGADGLVRVVSVRTPSGIFKRPISKLCLLPFDTE